MLVGSWNARSLLFEASRSGSLWLSFQGRSDLNGSQEVNWRRCSAYEGNELRGSASATCCFWEMLKVKGKVLQQQPRLARRAVLPILFLSHSNGLWSVLTRVRDPLTDMWKVSQAHATANPSSSVNVRSRSLGLRFSLANAIGRSFAFKSHGRSAAPGPAIEASQLIIMSLEELGWRFNVAVPIVYLTSSKARCYSFLRTTENPV